MRNIYAVSGGVSNFAKARPDTTCPAIVQEACATTLTGLGLIHRSNERP